MTAALIAIALSGLGLGAALGGVVFYITRLLAKTQGDLRAAASSLQAEIRVSQDLQRQSNEWKRAHEDVSKILGGKEIELQNEIDARKRAERQRDQFLDALGKSGDVKAVAVAVNKELVALSALGSRPR